MNKVYQRVLFAFILLLSFNQLFSQTLTDGPIQLQIKLRDVYCGFNETDASILGLGFAPDEPVVHCWAQDAANVSGLGWQGGICHSYLTDLPKMGTGAPTGLPGITAPLNELMFNYTYPTATVPQFYNLKMENFEDDNPSDQLLGFCSNGTVCGYDATQCCGIPVFGICVGLNEGDDVHCTGGTFATQLPYRNGPPCEWYDQGYIVGNCGTNWKPGIETYWRYMKGDGCANAIDLGTITSGGSLSHFNSNECYSNTNLASPGNDVWYKFHANGAIGITASLCGITGAQFDSYLYLYSACNQAVADTSNDDACGTQSSLDYSICQAGDYYLVVDGKTASDMGTFTLTVSDNPNFVFAVNPVKQDVSCFGGSDGQITANVQGGLPPYTYTWNPASLGTGPSVSGLAGGTYGVTVVDSKGCNATATIQINVPTQMTANTTATPVSCGGACDGSATVSAQNGTPPYSYAWNSLPPQQLSNAILLCANTYTVTVTDSKSCSVTASATVQNTTTVVITLDSLKNVQCFGAANGGIYLSSTGGQPPLSYAWSNTPVVTEDNPNLGPGTYTITITDNIGCTTGDTYTITEPPLLTSSVAFTFNPRCNVPGNDGIVDITIGGGVQPYSYLWSAPTNATTQNLNNVGAATHTVTVTDANGCTVSSTATLTAPPAYTISLTVGSVLCFGDTNGTASLNISGATPPYNVIWSNQNTGLSTSGLYPGPFSAVVTDANGCNSMQFGSINSPSPIQVTPTSVEPLCASQANGSITTVVTGGTLPYTYSWSGGLPSVANPTANTGNYTVTVADANSCSATASVGVNAPQPFTVNVVGINPSCQEDSTGAVVANTIGGKAPYSYAWSNSTEDTVALTKLRPATYFVTVTDVNGCTAIGATTLRDPEINPESCKSDKYVVLVPTAFSPNGDNVNDKLVAIMRNVQKLDFKVFNRWGALVYENTNMQPGDGWDGVFNGREQPIGTYIYVYSVIYTNGVHATNNGSATLIR